VTAGNGFSSRAWPGRLAALLALGVLGIALVDCAAVRGRRAAPEPSGFLGDYSQLAEREGYEAQLIYVDPVAPWPAYEAIEIDSVTLWVSEETGPLTDLLFAALHRELGERFRLVDQPGRGVLRLRAALTQGKGAMVAARAITSILPPAFLLSTAAGLSTDTASTVGTATVEMEVVDSVSGRRLAAAVDSRAGTKSILAGSRTFKKWGDVEAACEFWAKRISDFLARRGVPKKPGAALR
jgi:hypothetical protein